VIAKLNSWGERFGRGELDIFPSLHEFVVTSGEYLDTEVLQTLKDYLEVMKRGLPKYFLELINSFEWIRNYIPRQ
jgi:hypothetical protein